ncbi:XPG/RAD2 endonuclease [Penicillium maclennaniae]|uniref:XPG/RAD2 endonuclease n=1 Tax=Penicillium maclennaniae TaxID=1343394 RepID=UPI002541290B|nr:XPG/RAD2 endonuclease [Penicillium maclennaniae]KAJ5668163.1 XPG/RAD2 endonuclease [Penicillium maclennaniae]
MGIKGLHGLLKSIQKPCHIKKFSGQTLAVDAYGWLHRGTVACSVDLVLDRPTRKHIDFVLHRVRMLLYFGVTPYLVFDGDNLPSKAGTEQDRHRRRQESKVLGLELQKKGRLPEAYQEFQKAVDVTPYMARQLIEELKQMKVQFVVAPYEADAQMVYLEQQGLIHGIISEDSDLLVFGAKRLLSKLDQHGDCIEINRADFTACREVSLVGWSDENFRQMCILSGCDYLANIPKMGLKTAYRSIRKHRTIEKALRMAQFDGNFQVPTDYLANFKQAELTFLYQRVFCPNAKKLVTLTVPEKGINLDELPFIGGDVEAEIAAGVACGDLDPMTKEPIVLRPVVAGKLPMGISRRQTLGSELKPSKSINSFFTPKRTPLAELDPNSLTPSPSQQRLLERNANNSWQANSAPLRSNTVRSTPLRALSDQGLSPMIRSVERNSFLAKAARASTLQSTKRQRLSDSLPPHTEQASPSGLKHSRSKKQRKSTLDVFSDEIAEDIFSSIPDPASQGEGVENRAETEQSGAEAPSDPRIAQSGPSTEGQIERTESTPVTNRSGCALKHAVARQNSTVLSKYMFNSGSRPKSTLRSPQTRIPVTLSGSRLMPTSSPWTPRTAIPSKVPQRQRMTPLQRMGQAALTRSNTINFPTTLRKADSLSTEADSSQDTPTSPFAPKHVAHGSEDHIIPDSEDEEEDEPYTSQRTPLDLKRFSFAAN